MTEVGRRTGGRSFGYHETERIKLYSVPHFFISSLVPADFLLDVLRSTHAGVDGVGVGVGLSSSASFILLDLVIAMEFSP